jgi:hypothetical protein
MPRRPALLLSLLLLALLPAPARGQANVVAEGLVGVGVSLSEVGPGAGGGFSGLGAVGVSLRRVTLGGEVGEYVLGYDRKVRVFGGFVRFVAPGSGPVQPYLSLGGGAYRYTPAPGGGSTVLGGSVGVGARFRIGAPRVGLLLEARLHSDLDGVARVSTQEFLAIMGGVQLRL